MKVLVTGAAGFIGYHLSRAISLGGVEVVGIDSLNSYYDPALKAARLAELGISHEDAFSSVLARSERVPGFCFLRLSIEDSPGMEQLFAEQKFDAVLHMAAQAGVRYSLENPRSYVETNVAGFLNVLEGCRSHHVGHLVFASSSSVYGLGERLPFSEHHSTEHPASLYAATKKSNEMMAHAYSHLFRLPATGLRFFTVYGPWGRPDMAYYKFALCIRAGKPIDLFNSGRMMRDFTFVDDVVGAIERILPRPPASNPGWPAESPDPASSSAPYRIYNIGNSRSEPLKSLVEALERAMGRKAETRLLPMQPGDVPATEADIRDLERDFGWRPTTSFADGINRFVDWFRKYHG